MPSRTRGHIRLFGRPLTSTPLYAASRIGYMPQSGSALNNLTVGEALYFTAHLRGLARAAARAERDRLLVAWDLDASRDRLVSRLSGGQKRVEAERVIDRVGILRAGRLIAVGRPGTLKAGLDRQLRLEVVFAPGRPPVLPAGSPPRVAAPGRWHLLIERAAAPAYLAALMQAATVEDFHLSTPSLEDLYLALTRDA